MQGRGCVCVGTIERGHMQKGDKLEIIGYGETLAANVNDMQVFKQSVPSAKAGDHVGVLTKGVKAEQVCGSICLPIAWVGSSFDWIFLRKCTKAVYTSFCACRYAAVNGLSPPSRYNYKIVCALLCIYLPKRRAVARLVLAMDLRTRCFAQHGMRCAGMAQILCRNRPKFAGMSCDSTT